MSGFLTHEHFHRGSLARPADWLPRLIHADWLEEQGDARCEIIRLLFELLKFKCPQRTEKVTRLQELVAGADVREITPRHTVATVGLEMALIPPGEFLMGLPVHHGTRNGEHPLHPVRLTRPFLLGTGPVTQGEYQQVMGINPAEFSPMGRRFNRNMPKDRQQMPVENVTWYDSIAFCNRLSLREGLDPCYDLFIEQQEANGPITQARVSPLQNGNGVRLPTEAEWEYACRGGTNTLYHFGHNPMPELANFSDRRRGSGHPAPAGTYPPNAFGLYDMHGNVWEWCWDAFQEDFYQRSPVDDPVCLLKSDTHCMRGGSWDNPASVGRAGDRNCHEPHGRYSNVGFRIARSVAEG